jgi:hypothetical protein
MENINLIKPEESEVKGFKKFKNWASESFELLKIESKKLVVGFTVATMLVTSNCGGKSEIEWTGDKDSTNDQEQVDDDIIDEVDEDLIDDEIIDEDLIDDEVHDEIEDEEQDEIIDEEVQDEDLIDDEVDEEQDEEVQDEDVIEPVPETIVTLELNVDENVVRAVAGELIDINGMEFEVKYDNNDGSIYLMHTDEIVRIEWDQLNNANGSDVSVKDIWVNKTSFDTRILYKVTDVNNDKEWHMISNEKDLAIGVEYDGSKVDYVLTETLQNEDWDSGSRTIIDLETNVNGVEIKGNNLLVTENEGVQVANYYVETTYSANLYDHENTAITFEITCGEDVVAYTIPENTEYEINVCGEVVKITIEKPFFDEKNMKWWANVFTSGNFVKTAEQDKPLDYKDYTITVLGGMFTE